MTGGVVVKDILLQAHKWMNEYIKSFYSEDKDIMFGIEMKEKHTGYVTANTRELAIHLKLSEHQIQMAELIGLLHDVGRFRQWQLYKTFVDAKSEDHANLGVKTISEMPFLDFMDKSDKDILLFAVKNHNKKEIEPAPTKRHLLFAKIIRDADKLDIFRVLAPYLVANPDVSHQSEALQRFAKGPTGELGESKELFAPGFLESFVSGKQVDYSKIQTNEDRKLVRLMWVYDVNFSWTLRHIRDRGYIRDIIENLPQIDKVHQGADILNKYVAKKCDTDDLPLDL